MSWGLRSLSKKFKINNEKNLIVLLLFLTVMAIFVILMNLPSDLNKTVEKIDIQRVFVNGKPKVNKHEYHELNDNNSELRQKEQQHQQLQPPAENYNDLTTFNNTQRREKIKEVSLTRPLIHIC